MALGTSATTKRVLGNCPGKCHDKNGSGKLPGETSVTKDILNDKNGFWIPPGKTSVTK